MNQPRIDSIRYTMRRGPERRLPKAGDEKHSYGVLMVRQQRRAFGMCMVSNGRPLWEWVEWGSERDQMRCKGRYRTMRHGIPVPPPPEGWKIVEAGQAVPKGFMVFVEGYGKDAFTGWRDGEQYHGFEATYEGERRAFAMRKSDIELTRDLFEKECVCISEGHMAKQPTSVSAAAAVKKYMARCKCTTRSQVENADAAD